MRDKMHGRCDLTIAGTAYRIAQTRSGKVRYESEYCEAERPDRYTDDHVFKRQVDMLNL